MVAPGQAAVTIANSYSASVDVKINGVVHRVAAGKQAGPFGVTPAANGNDIIELFRSDNPTCGTGGAGSYFQDRAAHTVEVIQSAPAGCSKGEPSVGGHVNPDNQSI